MYETNYIIICSATKSYRLYNGLSCVELNWIPPVYIPNVFKVLHLLDDIFIVSGCKLLKKCCYLYFFIYATR